MSDAATSPLRPSGGGGQGEVAAARAALIQYGRIVRQHRLDQGFALRPRHQRGPVYGELEAPELAPAGEVGDRLARSAAADERSQPSGLVLAERQMVVREQCLGRKTQCMLHQQPGIPPRRTNVRSA